MNKLNYKDVPYSRSLRTRLFEDKDKNDCSEGLYQLYELSTCAYPTSTLYNCPVFQL